MKRTWAVVDLDAIEHNFNTIKNLVGGKKIMAVVKADAYGHGAVMTAKKLAACGADYFGVAEVDEAMQLAQNGIQTPILILGVTPPEFFGIVAEYGFLQTVPSLEYAKKLSDFAVAQNIKITVHIKVDTGMARLGAECRRAAGLDAAAAAVEEIALLPGLIAQGLFTHFAVSEKVDDEFTLCQINLFTQLCDKLSARGVEFPVKHTANSGAIFNYPQSHIDMVRPGLILYGLPPLEECRGLLKPALAIKSTICDIKDVLEGESVSYCRKYFAPSERRIAVVPIGYADGYPTTLTNSGRVLINGRYAQVVGRVCMDQMMVDVTDIPDAEPWQEVTILGDGITADEIAKKAGIISYEVICGIGKRIPRVYYEKGEIIGTYNAIL